MPLIKYIDKKLSKEKLATIAKANEIIAEYREQGYSLTLRQLYYQFVARGLIPNEQSEYKRLGDIISDGRRLGLIDWEAIEDRTRNLRSLSTWESPADIVATAAQSFRVDAWKSQRWRPEVWVEKDALVGILEVACDPLRVPYFACRGYVSDSEVWGAAQRLESYWVQNQTPIIFHLGDHDPSGLDMTRDIFDRVALFSGRRDRVARIEVRRLALNWDQIQEYRPPPNPAKSTDARYQGYADRYGDESWELDALEPSTIAELIESEIRGLILQPEWDSAIAIEGERRAEIESAARNWSRVVQAAKSGE
jgi:hypothetical protein